MRASVTMLLEAAYAALSAHDVDATVRCFAKDATFIIHLPPEIAPYFGGAQGRAQIASHLNALLNDFEILEYLPLQIKADGDASYSRVRFQYRHRATGLAYEGRMRHVWRVAGDRIVHFEEFHDTERVRTFFKLLEHAARVGDAH